MTSIAADFAPLVVACLVLLGSPGPAPLALAACGGAVGFVRSLPFFSGVMTGFTVALIITVSGFFVLIASAPRIGMALLIFSLCYIAWLAFRIAMARPLAGFDSTNKTPPGFIHGLLVNVANPKLYAAFTAMFAVFVPDNVTLSYGNSTAAVVMFAIATTTNLLWLGAGVILSQLFRNPLANRAIRIFFALLMLVSIGFAILGLLGKNGVAVTSF